MISFLVVGAELGAPIYKKPIIVFPLSDYNFLIPGLFLVNDFILILVLFAVQDNGFGDRKGQDRNQ